MAYPTSVNSQITDAVSQANLLTVGSAPAVALGSLYVTTTHALGLAAHNATTNQQLLSITAQAATTRGVAKLISLAPRRQPSS
ncbi:MAG: RebB family R body protein [Opitutae bacterium]|nr:RebB family R body protein [Opitutae bacterium]